MYQSGKGVPRAEAEAITWFRKAADQGDWAAQASMADVYEHGKGVAKDVVQAYFWWSLTYVLFATAPRLHSAAAPGEDAQAKRDLLAASMTPAQIAEAERLIKAWKPNNQTP